MRTFPFTTIKSLTPLDVWLFETNASNSLPLLLFFFFLNIKIRLIYYQRDLYASGSSRRFIDWKGRLINITGFVGHGLLSSGRNKTYVSYSGVVVKDTTASSQRRLVQTRDA